MSDPALGGGGEGSGSVTVASRLSGYLRGGGIITPLITVAVAFVVAGLVVAATGGNPIDTYKAIFNGTGLNWFFPWISADDRTLAALNLQQTLLLTTPLILIGLAVAFAFRAGLFNIGGQGQYIVGGDRAPCGSAPRSRACPACCTSCWRSCAAHGRGRRVGGHRRAPEGDDGRERGDLDDHAQLHRALDRGLPVRRSAARCRTTRSASIPVSNDVVPGARLPVFWGDPELQGLHVGFFIALAAIVVFWVLLNRSVAGLRGPRGRLQPGRGASTAASAPARNYVKVMAICGALRRARRVRWTSSAGSSASPRTTSRSRTIGFIGIAVALLGRNTAIGTLLRRAAVRRAGERHLGPQPRPGGVPARSWRRTSRTIIQGLIVLFVSAPVLVTAVCGAAPEAAARTLEAGEAG